MIRVHEVHFDDYVPNWHNPLIRVNPHIFVAVTDGRLHYVMNGVQYTAERGDLIFIPAGTMREAFNAKDGPHRKYAVYFSCGGGIGLPMLSERMPVWIRTRQIESYRQRFAAMHRQFVERLPYYQQILQGLLLEALAFASREHEAKALPKRRAQQIERLQAYILENYRRKISLKELAGLIGRSPNYTLSLFREAIGKTPLEYQHALRIQTAQELLRHTKAPISAIAEHLGYYDASSFYKMFKRFTGLAPSEFR